MEEKMLFHSCEDYQPRCRALFEEYKQKILSILPQARVEHIGASAVPNAISKGDLDIFVGVDADIFDKAIPMLCSLGFHEKLDTLRTDSLCMLESNNENLDVALQVVANGTEFEAFLKFRDALRANPDLVNEYNQLKRSCTDWLADDYRALKNSFIGRVLSSEKVKGKQ